MFVQRDPPPVLPETSLTQLVTAGHCTITPAWHLNIQIGLSNPFAL
jgi:hypothetical protein